MKRQINPTSDCRVNDSNRLSESLAGLRWSEKRRGLGSIERSHVFERTKPDAARVLHFHHPPNLRLVCRTRILPSNFALGSVMRPVSSDPRQLAPKVSTAPLRDLTSDTWTPRPRSRSTKCFPPFSMQAVAYFINF